MTTPQVGITHDVVIYDSANGLGSPLGLIVRPFSYRVTEAPSLVPRMAMGDPRGLDYEGYTSWVQEDFRGGEGQTRAPMPANNRYYEGQTLLPDQSEGFLGVGTFPRMQSIRETSQSKVFDTPRIYTGLNKRYYHLQCKGWYLGKINLGASETCDRYVSYQRVYRVGKVGTQSFPCAGWENDYSTVDAVKFSTCAVVSLQGSWAGWVRPIKIAVHTNTTAFYLPYGNTCAAALATYDSHLWRADFGQPRIAYYDLESVNDSITPQWSEYINVGSDGDIIAMTSFIGRLFIAKTTGIWAYEAGRTYQVIDLSYMAASLPSASYDFNIFMEAHGALYWNIGNKLFRYTAGGLLEEMAAKLNAAPMSAAVVRRGLAITTQNALWFLDTSTGGLYRALRSTKRDLMVVGSEAGMLRVMPCQSTWMGAYKEALFISSADGIEMAGEPGFIPPTQTFYKTTNQVRLSTSFVDLGRPGLDKNWRRIIVRVEGVPSSSWPQMSVYYKTHEEAYYVDRQGLSNPPPYGYTLAGVLNNSYPAAEAGVAVFNLADNPTSRAAQVMIAFDTPAVVSALNDRPTILGIELEGEMIQSVGHDLHRKRVNLNAVVTDGLELLNGEIENSASWVTTALYSLAGTGRIHTVAVPFPPPVGHTFKARVELGPTGAAVPILPMSYTGLPSGCPGSDISLVITET